MHSLLPLKKPSLGVTLLLGDNQSTSKVLNSLVEEYVSDFAATLLDLRSEKHTVELIDQLLLENIVVKPDQFYIIPINNIDKVSTAVATRLLKTLEEPPSPTLFLLTAQDKNKILSTIVNRITATTKLKTTNDLYAWLPYSTKEGKIETLTAELIEASLAPKIDFPITASKEKLELLNTISKTLGGAEEKAYLKNLLTNLITFWSSSEVSIETNHITSALYSVKKNNILVYDTALQAIDRNTNLSLVLNYIHTNLR